MAQKARSTPRREESLSRDGIIEASIEILDHSGEGGLTFRALSERLETGPGAIYWHIANKSELLTAAGDAIIARALGAPRPGATPEATIRALALGMFDAIEAHPWLGSAITHAPGDVPILRIFDRLGQQVCALGVPDDAQWAATSALLNYILGVSGQNAANARVAQARGLDRTKLLGTSSIAWSALDPQAYPFAHKMAGPLRGHDDRMDFIAGIDLILSGIASQHPR